MDIFVDSNLLVYLNVCLFDRAKILEEFWARLIRDHNLYISQFVLEELNYTSVIYRGGLVRIYEFVDRIVLPFVEMLPLDHDVNALAFHYARKYGLNLSDALHVATIKLYELDAIASDDEDFDRAGIRRIWLDDLGARARGEAEV